MVTFLLFSIFVASALSLLSYVYCWNDIRSGRPHIISLRQITNIMDRNYINMLFGPPQPGYYYPLSPLAMKLITRLWGFTYYREILADAACVFGAYHFMTQGAESPLLVWFILLAAVCQAINFVYSIRLIRRWGHQIREEMEGTD